MVTFFQSIVEARFQRQTKLAGAHFLAFVRHLVPFQTEPGVSRAPPNIGVGLAAGWVRSTRSALSACVNDAVLVKATLGYRCAFGATRL